MAAPSVFANNADTNSERLCNLPQFWTEAILYIATLHLGLQTGLYWRILFTIICVLARSPWRGYGNFSLLWVHRHYIVRTTVVPKQLLLGECDQLRWSECNLIFAWREFAWFAELQKLESDMSWGPWNGWPGSTCYCNSLAPAAWHEMSVQSSTELISILNRTQG